MSKKFFFLKKVNCDGYLIEFFKINLVLNLLLKIETNYNVIFMKRVFTQTSKYFPILIF